MGNLFRLNSLFELDLQFFPEIFNPPKIIKNKSYSLEYLFYCITNLDDYLFFSEIPDFDFLEYLSSRLGKRANPVLKKNQVKFHNLIEWGSFHSLKKNGEISVDYDKVKSSKILNSKLNQNDYLIRPKNFLSTSIKSFKEKLNHLNHLDFPYLFKPEYGLSGFGHKIIQNEETLNLFFNDNQIKNGVLQSFKKRFIDFSVLVDCKESEIEFLTLTKMNISNRNSYLSSTIYKNSKFKNLENEFSKIIFENIIHTSIFSIKSFMYSLNIKYEGPSSIDGFIYEEGGIEYICISEINFRFTMGRILFELSNIFNDFDEHILITESLKSASYKNTQDFLNIFKNKYSKILNSFSNVILLTPISFKNEYFSSCVVYVYH